MADSPGRQECLPHWIQLLGAGRRDAISILARSLLILQSCADCSGVEWLFGVWFWHRRFFGLAHDFVQETTGDGIARLAPFEAGEGEGEREQLLRAVCCDVS